MTGYRACCIKSRWRRRIAEQAMNVEDQQEPFPNRDSFWISASFIAATPKHLPAVSGEKGGNNASSVPQVPLRNWACSITDLRSGTGSSMKPACPITGVLNAYMRGRR